MVPDDDDAPAGGGGAGEGGGFGEGLEGEFVRVRTPDGRNKEFYGIADQLMGASRIKVNCEDGKSRLGRIPGKMKKRMWIRTGDLLIVKPWDFQDDKCDILYRYTRTQAVNLSKRGKIPQSVDIFQSG